MLAADPISPLVNATFAASIYPGEMAIDDQNMESFDVKGSAYGEVSSKPFLSSTANPQSFATGHTSSVINAAVAARKRGALSHLSESDRRSEFSYRSQQSVAASSDPTRSSKFKVVKLGDKTPYMRGRFTCFDFHDLPVKDAARAEAVVSTNSRVQTPTILADAGQGGTLTPTVTNSAGNTILEPGHLSLAPAQSAEAPVHNLHLSAGAPTGTVQRTGTLVPTSFPSQPLKSPNSRSPVPPNTPTSPGSRPTSVLNGPSSPEPFARPLGLASQPVSPQPLPSSASADQIILESLARKNPTPFSEVIARTNAPLPSGTMTPGRKISMASVSDPVRFLRNRGEAYFAEMIDRVWESPSGKAAGVGFDRIEAKIQQCMSLVTEHVLLAVRSDLDEVNGEVKAIKEKAAALEYENQVLKMENILLRNAVNNAVMPAQNGAEVAQSRSRMK